MEDEKQLSDELNQLVDDFVNGYITEDEYYECVKRINEDIKNNGW